MSTECSWDSKCTGSFVRSRSVWVHYVEWPMLIIIQKAVKTTISSLCVWYKRVVIFFRSVVFADTSYETGDLTALIKISPFGVVVIVYFYFVIIYYFPYFHRRPLYFIGIFCFVWYHSLHPNYLCSSFNFVCSFFFCSSSLVFSRLLCIFCSYYAFSVIC